mmetsp:Transcript_2408/g.5576  ORF Transcript_2408/g.5576 Transcript_2408/m.5576 type:complete len:99 (-) Transcript_2408:147-443(-)
MDCQWLCWHTWWYLGKMQEIGASRAPGSKKKEGEQRTSSRSIETPPPVSSLGNRASIHRQMRNHCTPTNYYLQDRKGRMHECANARNQDLRKHAVKNH